jgi:serine/threonine protein kinase
LSETISPNTTLGQYIIVSKIGEGGMGEVYLAQDTKLDRKVALKILPGGSVGLGKIRMRFKNTTKDVAEVARELNVDAVLTGRLMRAGDDLSVSVQLVDARTQKLIWAEQYDRKMADLMATQREIATQLPNVKVSWRCLTILSSPARIFMTGSLTRHWSRPAVPMTLSQILDSLARFWASH